MQLFHQGKLPRHLAVVEIDQKKFFGTLEWPTIRREVQAELPRRGAALAWEHAQSTEIQRTDASPYPSNRGTGQGDVDA
eukprot:9711698-Karenia_brevis.AAC.1